MSDYYKNTTHLSNSRLADFVHRDTYTGARILTPDTYISNLENRPQLESDAIMRGILVDEYFETGGDLGGYEPVARRTEKAEEEARARNVTLVKQSVWDDAHRVINRIKGNKYWMEQIEKAETQHVSRDDKEMIQGKFDWLIKDSNTIIDLKTTANIDTAEKSFITDWKGNPSPYAKYVRQLAFYRYLYSKETGIQQDKINCMIFIADFTDSLNLKRINLSQRLLDKAIEGVLEDIKLLRSYDFSQPVEYDLPSIIEVPDTTIEVSDPIPNIEY